MPSGGVVALVSLVNLDIAAPLALIPGVFLTYLVYVVELFNSLSPSLEVKPVGWIFWLGYYFLLMAVYAWAKRSVAVKAAEMI